MTRLSGGDYSSPLFKRPLFPRERNCPRFEGLAHRRRAFPARHPHERTSWPTPSATISGTAGTHEPVQKALTLVDGADPLLGIPSRLVARSPGARTPLRITPKNYQATASSGAGRGARKIHIFSGVPESLSCARVPGSGVSAPRKNPVSALGSLSFRFDRSLTTMRLVHGVRVPFRGRTHAPLEDEIAIMFVIVLQ